MNAEPSRSPELDELAAMTESLIRIDGEREQFHRDLVRSERRLRAALNLAPIGMMIVKDRHVLLMNQRLAEITGYTHDELVGGSTRILYATEDGWRRAPEQPGVGETRTVLLRRKGGETLTCTMRCSIVDHADREWVVTYLDPCCGT